MPDPFAVGADAAGALVRVIGDPWTPTIAFVQSNGQPLDLTGAQAVGADFYVEGHPDPIVTLSSTLPVPTSGKASFVIAPSFTLQAPERDPDFDSVFPTRLVGFYVDSLGLRHSDALILYCPVQANHARALPPLDDGVTVVVHDQGPAGPVLTPRTVAVTIATAGQTAIPLATPPQVLSSVALVVNGLAYRAPDIAVTSLAVTWAGSFRLDPSDTVVLTYV